MATNEDRRRPRGRGPAPALLAPRPRLPRLLLALALAGALTTAALISTSAPARAATLTPVSGFGSNPGNLAMYAYRPDGLAAGAPLVVALHGCTQNAQAYYDHSGWAELADSYGFTVIFPQTSTANAERLLQLVRFR